MRYAHYIWASIAILLIVLVGVGCWSSGYWPWSHNSDSTASGGPESSSPGGVAVVDLDAVAKQLGADVAIAKQIKDAQTSLDAQLRSVQASLRNQYEEKSKELQNQNHPNASPRDPEATKQELAEFEKKLNLQLVQAQQIARKKFIDYRGSLFRNFRGEVIPVAQEIAARQGLGIVLAKNDSVLLSYDQSHDITNALVSELRKNRSTPHTQQDSTAARPEPSASKLR